MKDSGARDERQNEYAAYLWLFFVLMMTGIVRWRLLSIPLDCDEGGYAYMGRMILRGLNPYRLCHTMHLPGTAAAYAVIMALLGQTTEAIHMGADIINAGSIILMFVLARRFFAAMPSVMAAACFALLSAEANVLGPAGYSEQFVVFFALAGIVVLLSAIQSGRWLTLFASGLLLGLSFLMKQPGSFFTLFAVYLLARRKQTPLLEWREWAPQAALLLLGAALPFAVTCLLFFINGSLGNFWFWIFTYARTYETLLPWPRALSNFVGALIAATWPPTSLIWAMALIMPRSINARKHAVFLNGFALFSFAAVCPGFYFRPHYFILALPAVSLLFGGAADSFDEVLLRNHPARRMLAAVIFSGMLLYVALTHWLFLATDLDRASWLMYTTPRFVPVPEIARFIRDRAAPGDRIAVIGSEPQLFFDSGLDTATGYVYMYPLMEEQPYALTMQKEMIAEITAAKPRFMVVVTDGADWGFHPKSDMTLRDWAQKYAHDNFKLMGIIDTPDKNVEYHWLDAASYKPHSPFTMYVFERK